MSINFAGRHEVFLPTIGPLIKPLNHSSFQGFHPSCIIPMVIITTAMIDTPNLTQAKQVTLIEVMKRKMP
jgi:hypothetical protein